MGTFQDTDGKGYLLIHHGPIYRLSDDYRSIEEMCIRDRSESIKQRQVFDGMIHSIITVFLAHNDSGFYRKKLFFEKKAFFV